MTPGSEMTAGKNSKDVKKRSLPEWIDTIFPFLKHFKTRLILFFVLLYGPIIFIYSLERYANLSDRARDIMGGIAGLLFFFYIFLIFLRRIIRIIVFFIDDHQEQAKKKDNARRTQEILQKAKEEAEAKQLAKEKLEREKEEAEEKKRQENLKRQEEEKKQKKARLSAVVEQAARNEELLLSRSAKIPPLGDDVFTLEGQKLLYSYACDVFPPAFSMAGDPLSSAYDLGNTEFQNPSEIMDCLSGVLLELSQAIDEANLDELSGLWKTLDQDTLIRGYKTFHVYQELSMGSDSFALLGSYLADQYAKRQ